VKDKEMIRRVVFVSVLSAFLAEGGSPTVLAATVTVTVRSQVMTPAMMLDPERITIQAGDTVTWLNLTGQGMKLTPEWEDVGPLPPFIRPGAMVHLQFERPGTYKYSVFTATDRFEEDRVPTSVSGVVQVRLPASTP
jgi:plastocyanin